MAGLSTNHEHLLEFFQAGTKLSYKKGEIIIRPEDKPQGVFIVETGYVKTYAITKYGEENLLIIRKRGEVFPMIWAISDDQKDVFYEAMVDTTLLRQNREDYLALINDRPEIAREVLIMAVEMYRIHSERVNNLEYRTAGERIAYRLLTLADRFGKKNEDKSMTIVLPLRHHDIATSVNCTRETASRELSKLERKKVIKYVDKQIVIPDPSKLKAML